MKKLVLLILFILGNFLGAFAQENVTKEEVLKLYHSAQKAEKENKNEEALELYKRILILDPNFPISTHLTKDKTEPPPPSNIPGISNTEPVKTIFIESTTLISVYSSSEQFEAQPGDIFEGVMKDGMVIQGKVTRNGETVKLFREKSSH
jgi:hypothetical protein